MNKNVAYYETITSRLNILTLLLLNLAIVIAIYFKGLEFKTYLAIAGIFVANCIALLCSRYTIQIDGTTIAFGYHFTGKPVKKKFCCIQLNMLRFSFLIEKIPPVVLPFIN